MLAVGPVSQESFANPLIQNGFSYWDQGAMGFQDSPPPFRKLVVQGLSQATARMGFARIVYCVFGFFRARPRARQAP